VSSADGFHLKTSDGVFVVSFSDEELKTLCGESATSQNVRLVRHFLTCWLALLYDSPLSPNGYKPALLGRRLLKVVFRDGLLATIRFYSALADEFMLSQGLYGSADFTNQWVKGFRATPIFREYHQFFKCGDPVLARYILSFCLFGKKLKFENAAWHSIAFRNWQDVEEKLSRLVLQDDDTNALRRIVSYLVGATSFVNVFPKFGPGKVAERSIKDDVVKSNSLRYHPYLVALCNRIYTDGLQRFPAEDFLSRKEGYYRLVSRLKFVPKDITKSRSICMEPNSVMFFQQALFEAYRVAFATGPMSQFVDLSDQRLNQEAAHYGSFSGDVDTIDLSSASDSVSFELIKKIFPKEHLFYLALSRSPFAETPDGRLVKLKKFAPMGSALCFPIECIVFTAISIYAAMCHSGWLDTHRARFLGGGILSYKLVEAFFRNKFLSTYGYIHPGCGKYQPLRVYGDDICVDSSLSTALISILTRCGFSVNEEKSFMSSQAFRESCGVYYLRGFDVTPIRYALKGKENGSDARFVASSIALSNRAGDFGLFNLKRFVTQAVLFENGRKLPFLFSRDRERTYAFYSEKPVNDHLRFAGPKDVQPKGCHSVDYQHAEVECLSFAYKQSRKPEPFEALAYDNYLYMRWWATKRWSAIQPTFSGSLHRVTAGSRLRRVWTPL